MRHLTLASAIAAIAVIGGCVGGLDPDQSRLCRIAVVALAEPDAVLRVLRQGVTAADPGHPAVRIDFQATSIDGTSRSGFAECRFDPAGDDFNLVAVRTDTGTLSDPNLYFLKHFWIETPEGDRADPLPGNVWSYAPSVPVFAARGLQDLFNALPGMAIYGLLAAAYSLIYGLIGRINLAFGEMAAIGGAASLVGTGFLAGKESVALVCVALIASLWAATLHGVAIGRVVFLPLRRATGQQGLVATIGLALVLNEYLRLTQGSADKWMTPLRATPLVVASGGSFLVTITPINIAVALGFAAAACAMLALMARSQFGRNWRALADDAHAAALLGVNPTRTFSQTFALSAALAGAAGGVTVVTYGSFGASFGAILGLKALLAAILGGIGSIPGALLGGMAISALEAGWSAFFPIEYRDLALFVLLACALIARPGGFLGYRDLTPRRV